jgi:hypothetical protein
VAVLSAGVAGCAETQTPAPDATALAPSPILKREGVSIADIPVALVSLEGAPEAARGDFTEALRRQFAAHEIGEAPAKKAHYVLRGYLAATPADGGANLEYVVDVYDARRERVARLSDGVGVKGAGDAWSLMTTATLEGVAGKCADDVAAFLSNTPEAKPATSQAVSYAE